MLTSPQGKDTSPAIRSPRDLLRIDAKDAQLYQHFSLVHLTAYSVSWLEVWGIPTLWENVTVLNGRLFPAKFALPGFPEFPDMEATNRSILQMRPKYRGFATSDRTKGVFLTEKGRTEAERVTKTIGVPSLKGRPTGQPQTAVLSTTPSRKGQTFSPAAEIAERKSRLLFRRFKEARLNETDVVHLLGLFGLYDHTPPAAVRNEFRRLREFATTLHDEDFMRFLDAVGDRFREYLARPDSTHRKE